MSLSRVEMGLNTVDLTGFWLRIVADMPIVFREKNWEVRMGKKRIL
jgi:hypothetical protein